MLRVKILLLVAMGLMCQTSQAQTPFEDLAKWVPENANSIVMVRAKDIFQSQIADAEKWKSERSRAFRAGVGIIPPQTIRFLTASQVDYHEFENIWQTAVFQEPDEISMANVSQKIGGTIDTLMGNEAVVTPNDAYVVKVEPRKLAMMAPANRQMASRWIRNSSSGQSTLSPYLENAVKFVDNNAHVVVAFDLQDVINADTVRSRIENSELYKSGSMQNIDLDSVCGMLEGVKGATLGITVNDKVSGAIKIDFKERPTIFAPFAKDLLLYILQERGLMIDDIQSWVLNVNDDNLTLRGNFTREGVRQIGFLIEQPLAAGQEYGYDDTELDPKTRSVQYFRAVNDLVDEMRKKNAQALKTYANWFDKYARQIDELSIRGVDEDLIAYGQTVADDFRQITGVLLGAEYDRLGTRENMGTYNYAYGARYNGYGYRRGGYAYSYRRIQTAQQRNIEGQAKMKGANQAKEIMRDIDSRTAEIRRAMSGKYNFDF